MRAGGQSTSARTRSFCNFATPKERSTARYAELGYNFEAQDLFGPINKNIAPTPGDYHPQKDPMVVLGELLFEVGQEAKAELQR